MSNNNYIPGEIENLILSNLNLEEIYKSDINSSNKPFVTMMPPPNVTGSLHMGHALVLTLQDILTRFHRMQGYDALWQLGVDHAGIATQLVVERKLLEHNIKKEELGREKFIAEVYKWKKEAESNIINQIKKIGASCDFSNVAFTMNEDFANAVTKVFVELYKEGLIYQDYRLVNWDTKFKTAISDLEVISKEEHGKFYYLKYPLKNGEHLIVATTRPETLLGDTALAVNPKDKRYKNYLTQTAIVPFIEREIPVIADEYSDMEKGSGVVKITPAHDFNDFEVGKRHNLPLINILTPDGRLNEKVPKNYQGLTIKEARKKIVADLTAQGLIEKIEDYVMVVPYADRSNTVVEPYLSRQWFVDTTSMAKKAVLVVKNKELRLIPETWENLYFEWLNNIKPWCISRQLWWGHQLPVWYGEDGKAFVAVTEKEALLLAEKHYHKKVTLKRDEDVLDTWFSSALWPFVTLGWPNTQSPRLQKYYPNSVLVTAFDIIFFWVTRMVMMGTHFLKAVPFKDVYLHALVLDEKGQKMSKTKGNVIDPLVLMEKYGTDALRFTLAMYSSHGRNIRFAEKAIEGGRNFVTKIWNAYRFLEYNKCSLNQGLNPKNTSLAVNKWILFNLSELQTNVSEAIKNYKFSEAANSLYQFIWNTYCDWYIEMIKSIFQSKDEDAILETKNVAMYVFSAIIKLLHPIMPFITEHLFSLINLAPQKPLAKEILPDYDFRGFSAAAKEVEFLIEIITKIRSVRASLRVAAGAKINIYFNKEVFNITSNQELIKRLGRVEEIMILQDLHQKQLFQEVITKDLIMGMDLSSVIDINAELLRLTSEQQKITQSLVGLNSRLSNPAFKANAKKEVIEETESQAQELKSKLNLVNDIISKLNPS